MLTGIVPGAEDAVVLATLDYWKWKVQAVV